MFNMSTVPNMLGFKTKKFSPIYEFCQIKHYASCSVLFHYVYRLVFVVPKGYGTRYIQVDPKSVLSVAECKNLI